MAKVLLVGGAGYIGSQMLLCLLEAGHEVVVLDNLSTGHRSAVQGGLFIKGDCGDQALLNTLFKQHTFDLVMHFAAFSQVGESVIDPAKYYQNNVNNTLVLLETMRKHEIDAFIFSSTAAIFGDSDQQPIKANAEKNPLNPYGRSKWMVEQLLQDYDRAYGFKSISLRYFNAAGADPQGRTGEWHEPETHLIPLILQTAIGKREHIAIYGTDYDTPDGTCIRDYIHVVDLCHAHLLAMHDLLKRKKTRAFNLGNNQGFSVREVIDCAKKMTGKKIKVIESPRRAGDPPRLIADATEAIEHLNWQPKFADLESIIQHAWQWEAKKI